MSRLLSAFRAVGCVLALLACVRAEAQPSRRPLIVLDAGHGGAQEGAVGPGGVKEKFLALQLTRRLRTILQEQLDANVVLTRDSDAEILLADRVAIANARRPDLFISIHANSMPPVRARAQVQGIETYFLSANASGVDAARIAARENAEGPAQASRPGSDILAFILADLQRTEAHGDSSRLAYAVHQSLVEGTGATDRGVHQAPFYVLNGLLAPAILVEVGYISHPTESKRLQDKAYQEKIATGIAEGVREFLEQTQLPAPATAPATAHAAE